MMDRSAELRAAGGGEPPGPAAALEAVPQLAAGLSQAHLTEAQRDQATRDILLAFLEASVNGSSGGPGSKSSWIGAANDGATAPHRTRGLQGQVVEHLIAGGFDEDLLQSVPTHTLNWAIKVRRCSSRASERRRPLFERRRSTCTATLLAPTAPPAQVLGEQQHPVLAEQLYHWMRVTGRANEHRCRLQHSRTRRACLFACCLRGGLAGRRTAIMAATASVSCALRSLRHARRLSPPNCTPRSCRVGLPACAHGSATLTALC